MSIGWAKEEVKNIVSDYFKMLLSELEGKSFNKTEHRKILSPQLANRSMGSIEFKHQNISAVMIDLGLPYITGYKPRGNYQGLLKEATETLLESFPELIHVIKMDVEKGAEMQDIDNILDAFVLPPAPQNNSTSVCENQAGYGETGSKFSKTNYLEREARNTSLGAALKPLFLLQKTSWVFQQRIPLIIICTEFFHSGRHPSCSCYRAGWIRYVRWMLYSSGHGFDSYRL